MLQLCYLWGAIVGAMGVMGWVRVRAAKGIVNFELGTSYKLAPAGGKKIMQRVKLTIKQYYFLQGLIKQSIITNVFYKDNHIVIIELSEDDMDKIRDLALDYLDIYGFDKDYELTESGKLAEELVDKLYT